MVLADGAGTALGVHLEAASPSEVKLVAATLASVKAKAGKRERGKPKRLIGDRGYDSNTVRALLVKRGVEPIIPARSNNRVATHQDGRKMRWNRDGVSMFSSSATGNQVQGNYIGTDFNGTSAVSNSDEGVSILSSPNNIIGGTAPGFRNIISGNTNDGVNIFGSSSSGNQVQGNYIGTAVDGINALRNSDEGVEIFSASNNTIGGIASGAGNTIAFNSNRGVLIWSSGAVGNAILGNSIFSNNDLRNWT
jgi:hypothetical protein